MVLHYKKVPLQRSVTVMLEKPIAREASAQESCKFWTIGIASILANVRAAASDALLQVLNRLEEAEGRGRRDHSLRSVTAA